MKRLFLGIVGVVIISCFTDSGLDKLQENREKWGKNKPDHYAYTYQELCFCAPQTVAPFLVRARDSVYQLFRLDRIDENTYDTLEIKENLSNYSISSIFSKIEEGLESDPDEFELKYDPQYGFPVIADFDLIKHAVDEEVTYTISDFHVLE